MFKYFLLNWIFKSYSLLIKIGGNLQSLFLLYMRMTWGHQFFLSGLDKLRSIDQLIESFHTLLLPAPATSAYLVTMTEVVCGLMLFVGFGSRLAAIPLIITMLVALSTAHSPNISEFRFLLQPLSLVKEAPYPFLITALLVFIFGPGRISIDAWIKRRVEHYQEY